MEDKQTFRIAIVFTAVLLSLLVFSVAVLTLDIFGENELTTKQDTMQSIADDGNSSMVDRRGVELFQNDTGQRLLPILTELQSEDLINKQDIKLTIDSELQSYVYRALEKVATNVDFVGGAGVIMDVKTGEVLTMVSYPEVTANGNLSINKVTNGLYVPGSVVKPFVAVAALSEDIISPEKEILSTGSIELPDPHQGGNFLVFNDWKRHGYVDMRQAVGVSSNVYFYAVGGGYEDQQGLGIEKLEEYLRMFGFGTETGIGFLTESIGSIPNPEWKKKKFNDEWRLGDTYLASIGQHGYEVTPLQLVRAVAAIANSGQLVTPTVVKGEKSDQDDLVLPIKKEHFNVVKDGMEYAVINGTAAGLYMDGLTVAAKTGTAEVDTKKEYIHSWVVGYFPHDKPKYAFTFLLEQGPWGEEVGSVAVVSDVLTWVRDNRPEYLAQP